MCISLLIDLKHLWRLVAFVNDAVLHADAAYFILHNYIAFHIRNTHTFNVISCFSTMTSLKRCSLNGVHVEKYNLVIHNAAVDVNKYSL